MQLKEWKLDFFKSMVVENNKKVNMQQNMKFRNDGYKKSFTEIFIDLQAAENSKC